MRCNRLSLWLASALIAAPSLALAAEEKKAGMPQLDPENFAPQIVWLVITFAILYVLLSRIGLPRVMDILDARHKRLDADLGEAERLKRETEQAIATYEAALTAARASAAVLTRGTITPIAPASSAFMIPAGSWLATRTSGVAAVVEMAGSMCSRSM